MKRRPSHPQASKIYRSIEGGNDSPSVPQVEFAILSKGRSEAGWTVTFSKWRYDKWGYPTAIVGVDIGHRNLVGVSVLR